MSEKKINWTKDQEQALKARNVGLAVSAAAGSGKTAVLTERIVRLLSAPAPDTLDVAKLCVVTFTKAAAGELEAKLYEALTRAVAAHPKDRRLASQLFRLDQAHISTIDSFCLDLIRMYRRDLDLRPGVRVCEETEEDLLFKEAQEEGLEAFLAAEEDREAKDRFYALFCSAKSRDGLFAVLKEMKKKADNSAEGALFFRTRLEALSRDVADVATGKTDFYATRAGRELVNGARETLARISEQTAHLAGDIAQYHPLFTDKRCDFLLANHEKIEEALSVLSGGEIFRAGQVLQAVYTVSLPPIRGLSEEEKAEKEPYDKAWNGYKAELKKLAETELSVPWQERQADLEAFVPLANSLVTLFETVLERFTEKKRDRNVLSFADLASLTLRLVGEKQGDVFVPTATGREIGERFQAVFVDEYQDTNSIQDAIFRCITGGKNLFLVGDPKQCVYHFRGAEPEVFIRYRRTLPDYDAGKDQIMARHFLSHNFRCDRPVIDFTNALFRVLMNSEDENSLYRREDELYPGRDKESYRDLPVELSVLEPKPSGAGTDAEKEQDEEAAENREAVFIARRIRAILNGEIKRADGTLFVPEDIAVIARTWKNVEKVQAALRSRGIPSAWAKGDEAETAPEEFFLTSLLRAADNPTRDVPLLAALYSPVFRFSPDDLFRLRKAHPGVSFYAALSAEAAGNGTAAPACKNALEALAKVRRAARSMTPTELIFFIYREFNAEELYRATSPADGAIRKKFLRFARGAEEAGFTTLARFCLYLSNAREKDDGGAGGAGVRLMTIHKAKGLEFPIVFVSFLSAPKKRGKDGGRVWMSSAFGAAFPLPKWGGVSNREHLLTELARREEADQERAEELRVLYVALTRAREKLILTGAPASFATLKSRTLFDCPSPLSATLAQSLLRAAANPLEFLFIGLHDSAALRQAMTVGEGREEKFVASLVPFGSSAPEETEEKEGSRPEKKAPEALPPWEEVEPYLAFRYAHPERETLPKKLSVSEIVRQGRREEARLLPRTLTDFERGVLKADAAFKGTAIHQAMQFANLANAARDPEGEIRRLLKEGFITEKMEKEIDRDHFAAFFQSDLYRRVAASPRVVHEKRFNVLLPGEALVGRSGEILIQGVVDLWFEKEDGTLAILDFKTDRLPPDGDDVLRERHGEQLRIYRRAVEAMEEKEVTELILYSFSLDRPVPVPLEP